MGGLFGEGFQSRDCLRYLRTPDVIAPGGPLWTVRLSVLP